MARRFWEDGDAVGRLVQPRDDEDPWLVVGVVGAARRGPSVRRRATWSKMRHPDATVVGTVPGGDSRRRRRRIRQGTGSRVAPRPPGGVEAIPHGARSDAPRTTSAAVR